ENAAGGRSLRLPAVPRLRRLGAGAAGARDGGGRVAQFGDHFEAHLRHAGREDLGRGDPRSGNRPGLSGAGRRQAMRNFGVLSVAAFSLALACGGGKSVKPGGGGDETPAWVAQGTGAFNGESGKKLQGVGVAP